MRNIGPRLLIAGAVLSAVVMTGSLFVYFQPDAAEEIAHEAETVVHSISAFAGNKARTNPADADSHENEDGSPETSAAANAAKDGIPTAVLSAEKGNISDLEMIYSPASSPDHTYSVMLDTALGPMLYYNQGDSRWRDYLYGGKDPMKQYGCGPTAVAMIVNSFSTTPEGMAGMTPPQMADWAAEHKLYAPQSGSYHSMIPTALSAYGLQVESVADRSKEHVAELLSSGHILVALMGKGALTDNGHFVLITGILENGNVTIADPNSYDNCMKEWDLGQILRELKKAYDHGAPLWAVGM